MFDCDLLEQCTEYSVDLTKVNQHDLEILQEDFALSNEDTTLNLYGDDIITYGIFDAADWSTGEFNEEMFEELIDTFIEDYPYYLVFAQGVRWNGASGYKVCDSKIKCFERGYDVGFYMDNYNGRYMSLLESSHDVPAGGTTYVIGITSEEAEKIEEMEFKEVEEFVKKKVK